jgi:hypothetical protein
MSVRRSAALPSITRCQAQLDRRHIAVFNPDGTFYKDFR